MHFTNLNNTPQNMARTAGALYLLIALIGAFAIGYVPTQIIVTDDAQATLANLQAHTWLYRAGILADIGVIIAEIYLTAMLFYLLRPVSPLRSLVAAMARFGMIIIMAANLLLNAIAFGMAQGAINGTANTILALLNAHALGVFVWGVLFGLHLLVLGGLVYRSGYLPKPMGGALFIGAFGYLFEGASQLARLESTPLSWLVIVLLSIVTLAELGFALWLLVKGVDMAKWRLATGRA